MGIEGYGSGICKEKETKRILLIVKKTLMIDNLTIQRIKEASGIVDVLGDFCDLRKDGLGYTCLCPFHADHHLGSFKISPRRNIYKCFSCGEQGGPVDFLMKHEGYSFTEAIQWLGKKYSIEVEGSERFKPKPSAPRTPTPPLPMLELDKEKYMRPTLGKDNTLTLWLKSLPWNEEQLKRLDIMLKNYFVGTSKQGHAIFWQVDDKGRCRTGKLMKYKTDGHRDKESDYNFDFIHSMLWRNNILDPEKADRELCIFGLHLIDFVKPSTVNIVESEKTAIICATAYGHMTNQLWLALGGASYLKQEFLQPLIDRKLNIVLYPDKDATAAWKEAVKNIKYKHIVVNDSFMNMFWREEDGPKADIADVLLRMMKPKVEDLLKAIPEAEELVRKLDLELITINKIHNEGE